MIHSFQTGAYTLYNNYKSQINSHPFQPALKPQTPTDYPDYPDTHTDTDTSDTGAVKNTYKDEYIPESENFIMLNF